MSKHFIYHIFGKKIGCTNNVFVRMKQQNVKEGEYEVLEEHTNAKTASVRERELQIEKGYKVDNIPYWKTLKNQKKAQTPQAIAKRVANTDYKVIVANTDYKARTANFDYKAKVANTDYKAMVANTDYKAKVANTDYKVISAKRTAKIEKSVLQLDKQGKFIKRWKSATIAALELKLNNKNICSCCRGRLKSAGGYIWKYAN